MDVGPAEQPANTELAARPEPSVVGAGGRGARPLSRAATGGAPAAATPADWKNVGTGTTPVPAARARSSRSAMA